MHVQSTGPVARILLGGLDPRTERELPLRIERLRQQGRPDLADQLQRQAREVAQPFMERNQGFPAYSARGAAILTSYYGLAAGAYLGWTAMGSGHLLQAAAAAAGGALAGLSLGIPVALVTGAILRARMQRRLAEVEQTDTARRSRDLTRALGKPFLLDRLAGVALCGAAGALQGPLVATAAYLESKPPGPDLLSRAHLLWRIPVASYVGLPFGGIVGLGHGWDSGTRPVLGFSLGAAAAGALAYNTIPWLTLPAAMLGGTLASCLLDPLPSVDQRRAFGVLVPPASNFPEIFPQTVLPEPRLRDLANRLITGRDLTAQETALAGQLMENLPPERTTRLLRDLDELLLSGELPADQLGPYLSRVAPGLLLDSQGLPPVAGPGLKDREESVTVGSVTVKKK